MVMLDERGIGNPIYSLSKICSAYRETLSSRKVIMKMSELKKLDAVLRMSRFSTKRKGNEKKRLSKRACRGKVIV